MTLIKWLGPWAAGSHKAKPTTKLDTERKLLDFVGKGKEFVQSGMPAVRAVIQREF